MKTVLIVFAVLFGGMVLACGGCFMVGGTMLSNSVKERDRLEALKSPEQKAEEKAKSKLESDLRPLNRKTREVMLERLKAPDGAKIDVEITHVKGLIAYAQGKVTSQNAYGAKLTKPVKVTWTRTNLVESFSLAAIEFEGQDFRDKDAMQAAIAAVDALNVQPK